MSNTANRVSSGPKKCAKIPCKIFFCWYSLLFWVAWWIGWLHSPTVIRKKQHILAIFTLYSFYTVRDLSSVWKIHTQPQQLGTSSSCWSPAWSHTAVGWHPIPQPGFVASQPTWLRWSLWHVQHAQADPTGIQLGWGLDSRQAIPSSPLPNSGGTLWWSCLCGGERCHPGGWS